MTVNNNRVEVRYQGDGIQTDFPVTFEVIDPVQVRWTPYEGHVVEDVVNSGDWIVRFPGPPTGEVRIYRDTPITQETQYNPYDAFPAEAHELALDKLTQIAQELDANKAEKSDDLFVRLDGDKMSDGNSGIDMNGGTITGLADAVGPTDAVSKSYMEANAVAGPQGPPGPEGPPFDESMLDGFATKVYVDDRDVSTLADANAYTDSAVGGIDLSGYATLAYADAGDSTTLSSANAYTDSALAGIPTSSPTDVMWRTYMTSGGYHYISRRSWYQMDVTDSSITDPSTWVDTTGGLDANNNVWTCPAGKAGWYVVGGMQAYNDNGNSSVMFTEMRLSNGSNGWNTIQGSTNRIYARNTTDWSVPAIPMIVRIEDGQSISLWVYDNFDMDNGESWRIVYFEFWGYRLGDY